MYRLSFFFTSADSNTVNFYLLNLDTKWNKVNGLHYRPVHVIAIGFVMFEVYYPWDQKTLHYTEVSLHKESI